jgi:type III pantothenate kinase
MLLILDIGNSKIKLGIYKNYPSDKTLEVTSIDKDIDKFKDKITQVLDINKEKNVQGIVITSVVPDFEKKVTTILKATIDTKPLIISLKLKTGIKFNYNPPSSIGADRIADSVAMHNLYPSNLIKIAVDFGTATVFEVISKEGVFLGGSIFPGLEVASEALANKASLLNKINFNELKGNEKVIGNTTDESLKSSLFWGYVSLVEGLVKKIIEELKVDKNKVYIVGTGGFATLINNHSSIFDKIEPNLTLEGSRIIYELNK